MQLTEERKRIDDARNGAETKEKQNEINVPKKDNLELTSTEMKSVIVKKPLK